MKRTYLYFLTIITWLMPALLHAAVWSPTWTKNETSTHVLYKDLSTNCLASSFDFLQRDTENGFGYYMFYCENTADNPGTVNVEYFLKDKVVLEKGAAYTFSMKVKTLWNYKYLRNAKVKVQLRDGTTSNANVLCELGDVDLNFDGDGTAQTKSLDFGSAPAEGYICLTLTGDYIETKKSYNVWFSDFSIDKSTASPPIITKQPEMSPNIDVNNVPTLSVTATGENLKYKWYYTSPGMTWRDCGCQSSSFTPPHFLSRLPIQVCCKQFGRR